MDRELLLAVLVPLLCGPIVLLTAGMLGVVKPKDDRPEPDAWQRMWIPILPAIFVLAALAGWAFTEPDDAEAVGGFALFAASIVAIVWIRASVRAAWALAMTRSPLLAATVGLIRPKVVLDPRLEQVLDAAGVHAVSLHERAHARHRDPFRIWIAQLIADLQWPIPGAKARLSTWLASLERARDDEAVREGADPVALADALVACARLGRHHEDCAGAHLVGPGDSLQKRVRRLLEGRAESERPSRRYGGALAIAVMAAGLAGVGYGERIVGWIAGAPS